MNKRIRFILIIFASLLILVDFLFPSLDDKVFWFLLFVASCFMIPSTYYGINEKDYPTPTKC